MNRYILIGGWKADVPIAKEVIVREDLINLKNGDLDWIIDSQTCTYFDPKLNSWEDIENER